MIKRIILSALAIMLACSAMQAGSFTAGDKKFLLNGEPFVIKAAEVHYPRIPRPYWEHRIKMCKALGMNTLCLYVFWNIHEPEEGKFDFTGNNDIAEFCRLAQKHGMYVIVRPGPYVCAEWEMGGLPWWLIKKKDIRLRERDPYFMERVSVFEGKVAEQLAPLTIANGGPIIMMQVENEYGSYGEDKEYVGEIRDALRSLYGRNLTLFQCDWSSNFTLNGLDDLVWTMNFGTGSNIDEQFARLQQLRPNTPLMCSEFWSGWFDKWGARHETRPAADMVDGIDQMLRRGISFSLYMTHGGTSFGHWAGANSPGFAPDVTSYDYDAPINEQGQPTEKYRLLRSTLQKYSDTKLPDVPKAPMPTITVPEIKLTRAVALDGLVDTTFTSHDIITFEDMDMGWGKAIYSTQMPMLRPGATLTVNEPHDYVQVYINHKKAGSINRVMNERSIELPFVNRGDTLRLVVEAMGRINFGRAIKDYKGITQNVTVQCQMAGNDVTIDLKNWEIATIPDAYGHISTCPQTTTLPQEGAGLYVGKFKLNKVGDTFLNLQHWGKGQIYVNGHALGRYWSIGPQQTLYMPGCWLRKGENEIMIYDVEGPRQAVVWGQDKPELDMLQLPKSPRHNLPSNRPDLNSATPVRSINLEGHDWQKFGFMTPVTGRYLAIEFTGSDEAALSELYLLGGDNHRLPRENWVAHYADSELLSGNHTLDKAFDMQESTWWTVEPGATAPHLIVIDLGEKTTITGLDILPAKTRTAPTMRAFVY
ncbi:MAG: beta-galactosidase [Bacteroidales bacterium]|nr:beta-galactosidase [Candidatus Sodaliphilus limicaballi]